MNGNTGIRVREATATERTDVLNVLDGSALATDIEVVTVGIESGDVLVAVTSDGDHGRETASASTDGERVLGALVLDGGEITAVAVRRRRRDQGIGTALVTAASQRRDRLVARFETGVRPFWESLGFDISGVGESDQYRGVRSPSQSKPERRT